MQLRLIFKEIPFGHIPAYFKELCVIRDSKSYLTLEAIRKVLMKNPFLLTEGEAELVARYCTEDNAQEKVEYDETTEVDFNIFKSIIRYIIGDYSIIPQEQMNQMFQSAKERLTPKKRNIIETFVKVMKNKEDLVSYEELQQNFVINDFKFTKDELMVILITLYKTHQSIDKLNYKELFD